MDALCMGGKPQRGRRIVLNIDHISFFFPPVPASTEKPKQLEKRKTEKKTRLTATYRAGLAPGTGIDASSRGKQGKPRNCKFIRVWPARSGLLRKVTDEKPERKVAKLQVRKVWGGRKTASEKP